MNLFRVTLFFKYILTNFDQVKWSLCLNSIRPLGTSDCSSVCPREAGLDAFNSGTKVFLIEITCKDYTHTYARPVANYESLHTYMYRVNHSCKQSLKTLTCGNVNRNTHHPNWYESGNHKIENNSKLHPSSFSKQNRNKLHTLTLIFTAATRTHPQLSSNWSCLMLVFVALLRPIIIVLESWNIIENWW